MVGILLSISPLVAGGRFEISYAVKSNPNAELMRRISDKIVTFDCSSIGEVERALAVDNTVLGTGLGSHNQQLRIRKASGKRGVQSTCT